MLAKVQDYSGRRSYTTNASQHQQPSNGSQKRKSPFICADQLPEGRLRLTASLPASPSPARPLQPPAKFSLDCVIFPLIHALLPKALTPFLLRIALLMERVAQLSTHCCLQAANAQRAGRSWLPWPGVRDLPVSPKLGRTCECDGGPRLSGGPRQAVPSPRLAAAVFSEGEHPVSMAS